MLDTNDAFSGGWLALIKIIRLSATQVRAQTLYLATTDSGVINSGSHNVNTIGPVNVNNLDTNSNSLQFTGTNGVATANDISQNWMEASVMNF